MFSFPHDTPFNLSSSNQSGRSSMFGQISNLSTDSFLLPLSTSTDPFASSTSGSVFVSSSGAASSQASSNFPFGVTSSPACKSTSSSPFGGFSVGLSGTASSHISSTYTCGATSCPASGSSSSSSFAFDNGYGGQRHVKHANWFVPPTPNFSDLGTKLWSICTSRQVLNPLESSTTSNIICSTPAVALSCDSAGMTQPAFGGELGGTRVLCYAGTPEGDIRTGLPPAGKIDSISAMPIYNGKSHEELRLEDYKSGDKGGNRPVNQLLGGLNNISSTTLGNPFSQLSTPSNPPANAVFPSTLFTSRGPASCISETQESVSTLPAGFQCPSLPVSPFTRSFYYGYPGTVAPTYLPYGDPSFAFPSWTKSSASATVSDPVREPKMYSSANAYNSAAFAPTSSSLTGPVATSSGPISGFSCFSHQPSPFFQPSAKIGSFFKQNAPPIHPNMSISSTESGFPKSILSSVPCSTKNPAGFNQTEAAFVASPPILIADQRNAVSAGPSSQTSLGSSDSTVANQTGGQSINLPKLASATAEAVECFTFSSPFGLQPPLQISVDSPCCTLSIQCGISSIKVPYFCHEDKTRLCKVDDAFKSKQNPHGWTCHSTEDFPCQVTGKKSSGMGSMSIHVYENGKTGTDNVSENKPVRLNLKTNVVSNDHYPMPEGCLHLAVKRHENGAVSIDVGHSPDVTAVIPKIHNTDYYTKPPIEELAARERAEPGFCGHVKDFVVGRQGYGSIKFLGETDVRKLDLESLIRFSYKEVIVYKDNSKKPPIGQGLNKPAEITLLNVKCIDKSTGKSYTNGPQVEKYREMLKEKAAELHAEMISYDPVQGEWKFRVQHF